MYPKSDTIFRALLAVAIGTIVAVLVVAGTGATPYLESMARALVVAHTNTGTFAPTPVAPPVKASGSQGNNLGSSGPTSESSGMTSSEAIALLRSMQPSLRAIDVLSTGMVIGFGGLISSSVSLLVFVWLCRRRGRSIDGLTHCGQCGYILKGLTKPRCPECGQEL